MINGKKVIKNSSRVKWRITISIGILAILLILTTVLTTKKNNKIGGISPELARAMNYAQFEEGDDSIDGTENVKFSAFFLRDIDGDGYTEKLKGTCKEIGEEDTLYMEINVETEGYLKDAKIQIDGKNFYLQTALIKDNEIKNNYVGNNIKTIELNQLATGTQKLLTGIVRSGDYSSNSDKASAIGNNINNYSIEDNKIILSGTYVDEQGNETPITKEVNLIMDWYGKTKTSIYNETQINKTLNEALDEENEILTLKFSINAEETEKELNISKSYVEGTIPQINGYEPTEVVLIDDEANFSYDKESRKFTIQKEAIVDETTGVITNTINNSNTYSIQVIYPLEAYSLQGTESISIRIPVEAYYEGYNNPNEEFRNPYRSNSVKSTIISNYSKTQGIQEDLMQDSYSDFSIKVGKYIMESPARYMVSKQKPLKIYNGVSESEQDDTYIVTWYGKVGEDGTKDKLPTQIIMKETQYEEKQQSDQFIKKDNTTESMENITKNTGIYFDGSIYSLVNNDGWINVFNDETDELLIVFDKDNIKNYNRTNPYKYKTPVKHIRIETSEVKVGTSLFVYNIKEIDDEYITNNYTQEEFENLQWINSTLAGYTGNKFIEKETASAVYEKPWSIANINCYPKTISTQTIQEHASISISTEHNANNNQIKWENGNFLVKLPKTIISAEINSIIIDNDNVHIESYELVKKDEDIFIKINTKNSTPEIYTINIDINLAPDPRIETTTSTIELYASNGAITDYYYKSEDIYDINNNLNTNEYVNWAISSISFVSPNSLLTSQIAKNYDNKESMVISPQIADIKQSYSVIDKEEKTAEIGIQIKNNYTSTISEIQILGKIPFEGNTYVIGGRDLESKFTTKMTSEGIKIPEELQGEVTVYYSENGNPEKEINNLENGWKTAEQITNWDNIKTFLIDFNDYEMSQSKEYTFNYTIKIPNGVSFNQVAYSQHGVYFSLETGEGKYKTQTESSKLGFMIAEKYNLEIIKYQTGKDKIIPGATYKITEEGTEEGKTAVTNSEGKLAISDLYAEKTYIIQEIKAPNDYEINDQIIKIIGHVDSNGNLKIETLEGTTRGDINVEKNEEEYKAILKLEDEANVKLKITKKEQETDNVVSGVKYKITGANLPENGTIITTDTNGEKTLSGLKINEEYTLEEIKAEGYYLAKQIKFKIVNNEGVYEIEIVEGEEGIQETIITEEECIPTVNLILQDKKIPTYNLEIIKIKKIIEVNTNSDKQMAQAEKSMEKEAKIETLAGAKFELYKNNKQIGEYITGEDGKVLIENLYQYVENKEEDATYTLKEVLAPVGYAKIKDITFKVQEVDGKLEFQAQDDIERNYTSEGNTLKLQIADSPSFKLIKRDKETQETIPNVKFAIYNIEEGEEPAKNSKGEILGTRETINGKEYYTVITNENGELTADLQEGLYKAVEVEAPDKYDISNQIYYFGIGTSRESKTRMGITQATSITGDNNEINNIEKTIDGGYIVAGTFDGTVKIGDKEITSFDSGNFYHDGILLKYNENGEIEWTKVLEGGRSFTIASLYATANGGCIIGGYYESKNDSRIMIGMIIKIKETGEIEWSKTIENNSTSTQMKSVIETKDGEYIAIGSVYYFGGGYNTDILIGNIQLTTEGAEDGIIIKYNKNGDVMWAKIVGGTDEDTINSVSETNDGDYIVVGEFKSSNIKVGDIVLPKPTNTSYNGIIAKLSKDGDVKGAITANGKINVVAVTRDEGYVIGGMFRDNEIQIGDKTIAKVGNETGTIIKCSKDEKLEWAQGIISSSYMSEVAKIVETNDGGYITIENNAIVKLDTKGNVEWKKNIQATNVAKIKGVTEINNGCYIIGGNFSRGD